MAITLSLAGTDKQLPYDLIWSDELAWSPITLKKNYSIEGAMFVDRFVRRAGRPITLLGGETRSWIKRSLLLELQAWASLENDPIFKLTLNGTEYQVIFDLGEDGTNAVRAVPVFPFDVLLPDDPYCSLELRFITV